MGEGAGQAVIRLRGVRHNNLKNLDLDLPRNRLIVLTGLSGSGKSSLAFDTLFAEGQRRYIETFSPYARQFFDRMDKPQVDSIEGIPPAIAVQQQTAVRTPRSTVGTMTELTEHLKVLWPAVAQLHCRGCGRPVRREPPVEVWRVVQTLWPGRVVVVTFHLPLPEKLELAEALELVQRQGFRRLVVEGRLQLLEEAAGCLSAQPSGLMVVQDRIKLAPRNRSRFLEACETAYRFGRGRLEVRPLAESGGEMAAVEEGLAFSRGWHCAECDLEYREPTPAMFSFNHPLGACPTCRGFGRTIEIDYRRAIPDPSLTLADGAVKPWQSGMSAECQRDLLRFCRKRGVPVDVPFRELSEAHRRWVLEGDPDYGVDEAHEWPRAWYGVKGYFRWLESKTYKMHVRVLLSRYRAYRRCPDCRGARYQPETLLYRLDVGSLDWPGGESFPHGLTLADFQALPLAQAHQLALALQRRFRRRGRHPLNTVLEELVSRLGYLVEAGLGYLSLDRPSRTLSGGETERVNLTACLGASLVNTLFVLDEPSVGLHPRDTDRLVGLLKRLREAGNTVVVVEHEPALIRAADHLLDLGPGHGESGGERIYQGDLDGLLKCEGSLTGAYLSGRREIGIPPRRPVTGPEEMAAEAMVVAERPARRDLTTLLQQGRLRRASELLAIARGEEPPRLLADAVPWLTVVGARRHNLRDLTVHLPLRRFLCVTGVSGSGKTTLVREVLYPALMHRLRGGAAVEEALPGSDLEEDEDTLDFEAGLPPVQLHGWEHLGRVLMVDQSPIGRTPRSNPALYVGAFDHIRDLYAGSEEARQSGLSRGAFSFNAPQGRCERCGGAGFEKIEMQFLSDVFIRCPECGGRRFRPHVLEVRIAPPGGGPPSSVGDLLDRTVEDLLGWLEGFGAERAARRAVAALRPLVDVGLGYLRAGQPINTLSGGESQRLKLAAHLARAAGWSGARPTLFLFDEPTTGLHYEDVRILLEVFQRLVEAGHSVLVIEHNLEVIKCADWVIDLGPEAGEAGGRLVVAGPPETVAASPASHTGRALRTVGIRPV